MPKPQVKFMRVAAHWFVDLCKGGETRRCRPIAHVLPGDAELVDSKITEAGTVILVIQSGTFPEVEPGSMLQELPATEFEVVRSTDKSLSSMQDDYDERMQRAIKALGEIRETVRVAESAYGQIVGLDQWAALERML